jgi:hypothetical protein
MMITGEVQQNMALLSNLGADYRLPDPLFCRKARFQLGSVTLRLDMMTGEWQHHAEGQMVAAA